MYSYLLVAERQDKETAHNLRAVEWAIVLLILPLLHEGFFVNAQSLQATLRTRVISFGFKV